ncbi:MAG: Uma2 family endonuclease [Bryobacteraceae bacterium]
MPATVAPAEQRVLLENVSWETFERLLAENVNKPGTRFAYDEGMLEIMVVHSGHESPNRLLAKLAESVALETGRDCWPVGSTTLLRSDLQKAFEPDSAYYFEHAETVQGDDKIDMAVDPPPELIIEVDISRSSLNRFPIYAGIGIAEVWRFDGSRVRIYRLEGGHYAEVNESRALPPLTAAQATRFLERRRLLKPVAWLDEVREWLREQRR